MRFRPAGLAGLAAGLSLAAPALGGATALWARAALVGGTAAFFLCAPPRESLGKVWNTIFLALAALALASFLPAAWFPTPEWRRALVENYAVALPATLSPQPWLSAEAGGLFLAGLGWAYWLIARLPAQKDTRAAVRFFGAGVAVLAAVALLAFLAGRQVPFWPPTLNASADFGFFPNRNQTASVLALAGVMLAAVAFDRFQRPRKSAALWLAAPVIVGAALVVNYSRAGIALFFGGTAAWALAAVCIARSRKSAALSVAAIAMLLAVFFLFGGATLKRFQPTKSEPAESWMGLRSALQQDAFALANTAPWAGQGLGNFEPIFAMARVKSVTQSRAVHPESDWLWAAVEMGWPAVALLLAGLLYGLRRCLPLGENLRAAAAVCAVAFALHGLVDVSGHRAGAAWPALFLFGIAMNPARPGEPRAWVAPLFRIFGGVLAALAAWWLASDRWDWGRDFAPTTRTLARLDGRLQKAKGGGDYSAMIATATEALRIAPLQWDFYFLRACAEAASHSTTAQAARDFEIARYLEPHWADSCLSEGGIWLALDEPERAVEAWQEALRRDPENAPPRYARMLDDARGNFPLRAALAKLAPSSRELLLVLLQTADRLESGLEIGALLTEDPGLTSFTPAQRKALFEAWYQRGDRSQLTLALLDHPAWQEDGWPWLARNYADAKNYEAAWAVVRKSAPRPLLPAPAAETPRSKLERTFFYHPEDFQNGLALYFSQKKSGETDAALATVGALQKIAERPAYVAWLEAELWAEKGEWEKAWRAWQQFTSPNRTAGTGPKTPSGSAAKR